MMRTIPLFILLAYSISCFASYDVSFHVSMDLPHTHYYQVEMNIKGELKDSLILKLPVWTPGYYKIMDYPINLFDFKAESVKSENLYWKKNSKNTWVVKCIGEREIKVEYKIFAFEKSVADCYLDSEMGYICPTGMFMHIAGNLDMQPLITITPYSGWNSVSTGLDRLSVKGFVYKADNFDQLYDCPILIGNHNEYKFEVDDIPYTIAYNNQQHINFPPLIEDLKKIIKTTTAIFEHIPYKHYTFIIMQNGRGGLEHQNSMAVFSDIQEKSDTKNYKEWLSFITHEFFHLYNVKAIRPINLGPFDYDRENYTNMLWVSEGFTVYYENRILLKAGHINEEEFLKNMSKIIRNYENSPGRLYQSAVQSSFDAWIDFFQFKENKKNTSISYYDKGCALGMLLDLKIRHETHNGKSLDDVMKQLYNEFYIKKKRGFTDSEFRNTCEKIAGNGLDGIFDRYAATTATVNYPKYLNYAGLSIDTSTKILPGTFSDLDLFEKDGKVVIGTILSGSPSEKAGLSTRDEILKLNGRHATIGDYKKIINSSQPGDEIDITFSRNGKELLAQVKLITKTTKTYTIKKDTEPNELQVQILKKWLLD